MQTEIDRSDLFSSWVVGLFMIGLVAANIGGILYSASDGRPFIGNEKYTSRDFIEVDPKKAYRITAEIKASQDDPSIGGARTYIGVITYDANKTELTSGPGTYRYAAMNSQIIKSAQGWVKADGLITGQGDENYNQFRPGTRFIKLVALLNYHSPQATSYLHGPWIKVVP